jgi:uncharacterized protein YabE (DUF348 family)/3D (Asp-Asp-Asp) domain-containing protein
LTSGRGRRPGGVVRLLRDAGRHSLLLDHRRRRHLAVLSAILAVSVFAFLLLQPRHVRVQADGRDMTVETHLANDSAVLSKAGVRLAPGDRVTQLDGHGVDVLRVDRARDITLTADGETYAMRTHAVTIDQLLAEADVVLNGRDSVLRNSALVSANAPVDPPALFVSRGLFGESAPQSAAVSIEVRRAVPFTIVENGGESASTSSRPTVAQALREAGVVVGPGDAVTPDLQAPLDADARIDVRHARAVTLALPDGHEVRYTLAQDVGEVLAEAGVTLPEGAFVEPSIDTPVTAGMSVRVVQLSASNDVEREFIESKTVYESDESLDPGEIRTVKGHDGAKVRRYEVSYVDGVEAGRELVDEYYDPEPVDTVIYYPTRTGRNDATPPSEGGTVGRTINVYATYYTPASAGRAPSDPGYGITATGRVVTYGIVAVDPSVIPLGTRMFIPGYGYAIAADTGGAVKGYIIDLGFPDGVAVDWQPKWLDIYILS